MAYVRVRDGNVAYPYSLAQLRADEPDTSLAAAMPDERLAEWDVFPVTASSPPDTAPDDIAEEAEPALVEGVWTQQWTLRDRTSDELGAAKAAKWAEAKARRDAEIDQGCAVPGVGTFDTDPLSRSNINGAVTGALIAQAIAQPFSINWKLQDNSIVELNGTGMIAAGVAVLTHVSACHDNAQILGMAIDGAKDFATLNAIDIGAGWP